MLVPLDQVQELFPGFSGGPHAAQHATGGCGGRGLLYTAHDHAEMARLNHDSDTLRLEHLREGECNLLGESLLDLQAAGKHLSDTGELGETDDAAVGDVSNVHLLKSAWGATAILPAVAYLSGKWHEVVLAQREDLDILHYNQLIMVLVEHGAIDDLT